MLNKPILVTRFVFANFCSFFGMTRGLQWGKKYAQPKIIFDATVTPLFLSKPSTECHYERVG